MKSYIVLCWKQKRILLFVWLERAQNLFVFDPNVWLPSSPNENNTPKVEPQDVSECDGGGGIAFGLHGKERQWKCSR